LNKNHRKFVRCGKGFTLVEVMVATVIFVIAVIGTSSFFYFNRQNLVNARRTRQATWVAIEGMEEIKSKDYSDLLEEEDSTEDIDRDGFLGERITEITLVEEDGEISFLSVKISVQFNNSEVVLNTYIADTN
jgi:prepilin-type N-terminal cleavage/methylation domain-containing protein